MKSHTIHNTEEEHHQEEDEINPNYSTHIAPTDWNIHLPPNYYEDTARGRPDWWVNRYLKASFNHAEGMVYPRIDEFVVNPFEIPPHWKRGMAADFGLVA